MMIYAHCEYCRGVWLVKNETDPDVLEGHCLECEEDRDVEKPLEFGCLEELPEGWLVK